MTGAPDKAVYWQMTAEYGRMYTEMLINWTDRCINMIESTRTDKEAKS